MSYAQFEQFAWDATKYGAGKISFSEAEKIMAPLLWYVGTGRAGFDFMAALATKKPWQVFRQLAKNAGSYEETLAALRNWLGV